MRKLFYFIFIISIVIGLNTSCEKRDNTKYTISLDISKGDSSVVFLSQRQAGEMINYDSVLLVDGKGTISGYIEMPEFYYLRVKDTRTYFPLFVEAGNITVKADLDDARNAIITGSKSNETYEAYNDSLAELNKQTSSLSDEYGKAHNNNDTVRMAEIEEEYNAVDKKRQNI